jgi:hypothetical protein
MKGGANELGLTEANSYAIGSPEGKARWNVTLYPGQKNVGIDGLWKKVCCHVF